MKTRFTFFENGQEIGIHVEMPEDQSNSFAKFLSRVFTHASKFTNYQFEKKSESSWIDPKKQLPNDGAVVVGTYFVPGNSKPDVAIYSYSKGQWFLDRSCPALCPVAYCNLPKIDIQ